MPPFSKTKIAQQRLATLMTAAARAREEGRNAGAQAEQRIIDSECRATKLALTQDKEAWRVYRRQRGKLTGEFVPYLT